MRNQKLYPAILNVFDGTPNAEETVQEEATNSDIAAQPTIPYKVYATPEEWQKEIDKIIGSRLKDYRKLKERLDKAEELITNMLSYSGANDMDELGSILKEACDYSPQQEQTESSKIEDGVLAVLKQFPNETEAKLKDNKEFTSLLQKDIEPVSAYKMIYFDQLLEDAARKTQQETMQGMRQKSERIAELGAANPASFRMNLDPSGLSLSDIRSIKERARRGEKISL